MNQKGVFLTLMVFLVAIVAVSLAVSNYNLEKQREVFTAEQTAFQKVNEQFEKVDSEFKNLAALSKNARYHSRLLPFDYNFSSDEKTLRISQKLPTAPSEFSSFYDLLNTYTVLWSNPRLNTGIKTDFNFGDLNNLDWGGSIEFPDINYRILPGCVVYSLDYNKESRQKIMRFKKGTDGKDHCSFSWAPIKKISVKVISPLNPSMETGGILCEGDFDFGAGACRTTQFTENPDNPPFVEFSYQGPASSKYVSAFLTGTTPPDTPPLSSVSFWPDGISSGDRLVFSVNSGSDDLLKLNLGPQTGSSTFFGIVEITFDRPVDSFELQGYGFSVQNPIFAVSRQASER
ncbi:MAG: hypothetical protein V1777_03020 [Candidatus Micrarchaeota archaeon]